MIGGRDRVEVDEAVVDLMIDVLVVLDGIFAGDDHVHVATDRVDHDALSPRGDCPEGVEDIGIPLPRQQRQRDLDGVAVHIEERRTVGEPAGRIRAGDLSHGLPQAVETRVVQDSRRVLDALEAGVATQRKLVGNHLTVGLQIDPERIDEVVLRDQLPEVRPGAVVDGRAEGSGPVVRTPDPIRLRNPMAPRRTSGVTSLRSSQKTCTLRSVGQMRSPRRRRRHADQPVHLGLVAVDAQCNPTF